MDESVVRGAIESWTDTGDLASKLCEMVKERREREREREKDQQEVPARQFERNLFLS